MKSICDKCNFKSCCEEEKKQIKDDSRALILSQLMNWESQS